MEPILARVDLDNRHEGVLLRLTLSPDALQQLTDSRELRARMGEDGVFLMEDSSVELLADGDHVELVRLEVHVQSG